MADLRELLEQVRRLLSRFRRPLSAGSAALATFVLIHTLAPSEPQRRAVVVAAHDLTAGVTLK